MKKPVLALLASVLMLPLAAQFPPPSLQSVLSFGLTENEIDRGFQANAAFGDYPRTFIFGGLGNPGAGLSNQEKAWDSSFSGNLQFGLYMPKGLPIPLSAFGGFGFTNFSAFQARSKEIDNTHSSVSVVNGTTTTDMYYVSRTDTIEYTWSPSAKTSQIQGQILAKLAGLTLGFVLDVSSNNSAADAAAAPDYFSKGTAVRYYRTSGAGVAPTTATDYTETFAYSNIDSAALPAIGASGQYALASSFAFGVPVALKTGDLEHRAYIGASFGTSDSSGSASIETSAAANTIHGTLTDQVLSITSKTDDFGLGLRYHGIMPGFLGGDFAGKLHGYLSLSTDSESRSYSYEKTDKDYAAAAINTKTATGGAYDKRTRTFAGGGAFSLSAQVGQSFAFAPKGARFEIMPLVGFSFSSMTNSGNAYETASVTDSYSLTSGFVQDTTVNSTNTSVAVTGKPASSSTFGFSFSLPGYIEIKPESWIFGVVMGAQPSIGVSSTSNTAASLVRTTTTTVSLNGAVTSTTVTSDYSGDLDAAVSTSTSHTLAETHYIGIYVPLDGEIRLDIRLNGSLLNFESFTIQAFLPLN